jgi:hypothetical protein
MRMSDDSFLEFLSRRHFLPSFNLPIDSIVFVARTARNGSEEIEVRMSDGLEKALTGYGPGRELMYMKKQFTVGGLYIEFPPTNINPDDPKDENRARMAMTEKINRFQVWYDTETNISWYHMCRRCMYTPTSVKQPDDTKELESNCKMCNADKENWISRPLIRPPGFAPLIYPVSRYGKADVVPAGSRDSPTYRLATRWPTQIQDMNDLGTDSFELGDSGARIGLLRGMQIVDVNPGLADLTVPDQIGFEFCRLCGCLDVQRLKPDHNRPYAIPFSDGLYAGIKPFESLVGQFNDDRQSKCKPGHEGSSINGFKRIILGRRFKSDLLVLDIPWPNEEFISPHSVNDTDPNPALARAAAMTICQALLQAATSGNCGLAISPSDVGGDVRHYIDEDDNSRGFHVFLYERADGGAGLLKALFTKMGEEFESLQEPGSVIEDLLKVLSGGRCSTQIQRSDDTDYEIRTPCSSICNGCLQDFTTQHIADQLDRELGFHLLLHALHGELDPEWVNLSTDHRRLELLVSEAVRDLRLSGHEPELLKSERIEGENHREGDLPDDINEIMRSVIGVQSGIHEFTVVSTLQDVTENECVFRAWDVRNDPEGVISRVKKVLRGDDGDAVAALRRALGS